MKPKSFVRKSLVGVACMSFMLGVTARATDNVSESKSRNHRSVQPLQSTVKPKIILVDVTGSRIPQRVTIHGQQVNSASPLFVIAGDELLRSGATSVTGILAQDPSITFHRRR